jgi:hypothetical protein
VTAGARARRITSAIVTFVAIDLASAVAFAAPAAISAASDDIRDIRGPIAIPPWWRWPLVVALAAAAALAVVLLVRWWRARAARALSPLERARLALEVAEAHARAGRAHEWADIVAETTRGALAARLGAAILPQTTSELAKGEWTRPPMADEVDAPRVLDLLETCDLARFARAPLDIAPLLAATAVARESTEQLFAPPPRKRSGASSSAPHTVTP